MQELSAESGPPELGWAPQNGSSMSALTPSHPTLKRGQLPQLIPRAQPGLWLQQDLSFFQVFPLELLWPLAIRGIF